MPLIETINLTNNSVISAIDKLKVEDGETLVFYIRLDQEGQYLMPVDIVLETYNFIEKFVKQNYNNVKILMVPEGIRYVEKNI